MNHKTNKEYMDLIEKTFVGILCLDEYSVFDRDSLDVHYDDLMSRSYEETIYEVTFKRAYTNAMSDYQYSYSVRVQMDEIIDQLLVEMLCGEDTWHKIENFWSTGPLWVSVFCDTENYYLNQLQKKS